MNKITFFFTVVFLLFSFARSSEPTLAILDSVYTNEIQKFKFSKSSFYCRPYGVRTISGLYSIDSLDSVCKKSVESFYRKNPKAKHFTAYVLRVAQTYHLEFKKDSCVIYAKGQKSLSELLLEQGLALQKLPFNDEEFNAVFNRAQKRAEFLKLGIWSDGVIQRCMADAYSSR